MRLAGVEMRGWPGKLGAEDEVPTKDGSADTR